MLVLAMEFSRCAQRGYRTISIKEQTDGVGGFTRASGLPTRWGWQASRRRVESPRAAQRTGTVDHSLKTE